MSLQNERYLPAMGIQKGNIEVCSILSYQRGTGVCSGKQKDLTISTSQISVYYCNSNVYLLPKQVRYQAALHPVRGFFLAPARGLCQGERRGVRMGGEAVTREKNY
jgi:hypothetical protein